MELPGLTGLLIRNPMVYSHHVAVNPAAGRENPTIQAHPAPHGAFLSPCGAGALAWLHGWAVRAASAGRIPVSRFSPRTVPPTFREKKVGG